MRVLGLSAFHRDSAAGLCVDGRLVASAQEERFTGKRVDSSFPRRSARACLDLAGVPASELDALVFYEKPLRKFERTLVAQLSAFPKSAGAFSRGLFLWLGDRLWLRTRIAEEFAVAPEKVQFVEHARSHAAYSYFSSPYEEAAILVIDDMGEWATTSFAYGKGARLELLSELPFPHSLGLWCSAYAQFLGFEPGLDEERIEALAHYGQPRFDGDVASTLPALAGGGYAIDTDAFRFAWDAEKLFDGVLTKRFGAPRMPGSPLDLNGGSRDADLAASVQGVLEARVLELARALHERTKCDALCLAGEVARNRSLVARLAKDGPFRELHAPPALGEAGAAAGAALAFVHAQGDGRRNVGRVSVALGERVDVRAEEGAESLGGADVVRAKLVELLSERRTVAWVRGALELGPESLGNRLILADARGDDARERLLGALQRFERYMPARVLVTAERVDDFFVLPAAAKCAARDGSLNAIARDAAKSAAPSALAPDGAVWLQVVDRERDAELHALLEALAKRSGAPLALAASFHLRGRPIVRTEADAVEAFRRSSLDALVVEDRIYGRTSA